MVGQFPEISSWRFRSKKARVNASVWIVSDFSVRVECRFMAGFRYWFKPSLEGCSAFDSLEELHHRNSDGKRLNSIATTNTLNNPFVP